MLLVTAAALNLQPSSEFSLFLISSMLFACKSLFLLFLLFLGLFAFYVATFEEYHTLTLYLGYVSGPIEGNLLAILFCLISGWKGM
jgi:ethanolaminephosphotransferase